MINDKQQFAESYAKIQYHRDRMNAEQRCIVKELAVLLDGRTILTDVEEYDPMYVTCLDWDTERVTRRQIKGIRCADGKVELCVDYPEEPYDMDRLLEEGFGTDLLTGEGCFGWWVNTYEAMEELASTIDEYLPFKNN